MTFELGNLRFGGRIIMQTDFEVVVELPCEIFIRLPLHREPPRSP